MPTTKRTRTTTEKPAAQPATETTNEIIEAQPAIPAPKRCSSADFVRKIHQNVTDELEGQLDRFLQNASLEEKRFMNSVMIEWDSRGTYDGRPREADEYDVPIYGAVQRSIDDKLCLLVNNEDLIPQIEEFIAALERKSYKRKPFAWGFDEKEIQEGFRKSFRSQIEIFAHNAGTQSLRFMRDLLARWSELQRDPEGSKLPNILAAAVEFELERFIADEAAEKAKEKAA